MTSLTSMLMQIYYAFIFYYNMLFCIQNDIQQQQQQITPFEDKYKESLKLVKDENQIHTNNYVMEFIPNVGTVVMYYDTTTNNFKYYCDAQSVQYTQLQTVGRKYAVMFCCPRVIKDKDNTEDSIKPPPSPPPLPPQKNTRIVKLKKYNILKKYNKLDDKPIINFIRIGRLCEFNLLGSTIEKKKTPMKNNISYVEYKNGLK